MYMYIQMVVVAEVVARPVTLTTVAEAIMVTDILVLVPILILVLVLGLVLTPHKVREDHPTVSTHVQH